MEDNMAERSCTDTMEGIFMFNGNSLSGRNPVVFEEPAMNGNIYCEHKDIEDEERTVSLYTRYTPIAPVSRHFLYPPYFAALRRNR